jgi:hypothetical protein
MNAQKTLLDSNGKSVGSAPSWTSWTSPEPELDRAVKLITLRVSVPDCDGH